ncbi:hypothetical protein [Cellulomonas aerilata]|uniref:Uncharacterized protein n=1 Tax=Cellulomonas aerilata TaxID=515326 RepID=A0A512DD05_9CELL|nr:hypothetical protein [Cellulomonas aerilata]GEO34351.1 hypothetical protein CAE01nite_20760 [Cellulomonas aerilata]
MIFRISFVLAALYVNFSQKYFPTNIMARWMRQPGHLRFAWPLSVGLYLTYYGVARWIHSVPATETSGWLQFALAFACLDALEFACGAVVWPFMGTYRGLRHATRAAEIGYDAWRSERTHDD